VNTIIEFHDSKFTEISKRDSTVIVHFLPVGLHKSEGRLGIDSGTYWLQEAQLIFSDASVSGDFPDQPYDVMDGELVIGDKRYGHDIPVPLDVSGPAELRLKLDNIHTVTVTGRGVRLELLGEARYLQDFPWV